VAVPIPDGRLAAAISLSAPAARFSLSAIKKVAVALREVAVELPRDLGGVGA
jgi:DNA-binding IclR family transcriptional regulator